MRKKQDLIRLLCVVFAVLIVVVALGGGFYLYKLKNSIKELNLSADFSETELNVGTDYTFSVKATPEGASLKKLEYNVDDSSATFRESDDGKVVLHTGNEGTVSVYVQYKDISSNVLTFAVVDQEAKAMAEAQAQAEAEAAAQAAEAEALAQAEAEAAAAQAAVQYVECTGDNVNVRPSNSTDGEPLGKAKMGEKFEKVEEIDDWTHIIYNGQDGYMKTEFLKEATDGGDSAEASEGNDENAADNTTAEEPKQEDTKKAEEPKTEKKTEQSADDVKKAEETKTEEKKAEETKIEEKKAEETKPAETETTAEDLKKAEETAKAAAEAATAAVAAAAPATGGTAIYCKDGTCYVTASQLQTIHATWDFAGDAIEMAGHHSIGELEAVVGPTQH